MYRLPRPFALLRSLAANDDGNIAFTFALTISIIIIGVGASLDYSNALAERGRMQDALDAAVLAAASKGPDLDEDYAKYVFYANTGHYTDDSDNVTLDSEGWTQIEDLEFHKDDSGNFVGNASGKIKTSIMGIVGVNDMDLSVTSSATGDTETKMATATFSIDSAKGAYDKDIYFYTRDSSGNILSETLILEYDYTYKNSRNYYGTLTPSVTSSTTVNVGDYSSYGYKMVVYEDTSYKGYHINPKSYYSDDADADNWTKVTGECTDASGSKNYWEDGGDADFKDFIFTLTCTETEGSMTDVRLVN